MLTKSDLTAIQKIVDSSIQKEINPLKDDVRSLQAGMSTVQSDVNILKTEFSSIKKDIKNIKSNQRGLNKTVNVMIDHFDRDRVSLRKRVDNIEKHVGITNSS